MIEINSLDVYRMMFMFIGIFTFSMTLLLIYATRKNFDRVLLASSIFLFGLSSFFILIVVNSYTNWVVIK